MTYALEGICLVLPVEASMSDPTSSQKVIATSLISYSILVGAYASIAVVSGLGSCDVITECLPGVAGDAVKVALSVALAMGHCVTLFPAVELLEGVFFDSGKGDGGSGGGVGRVVEGGGGGGGSNPQTPQRTQDERSPLLPPSQPDKASQSAESRCCTSRSVRGPLLRVGDLAKHPDQESCERRGACEEKVRQDDKGVGKLKNNL